MRSGEPASRGHVALMRHHSDVSPIASISLVCSCAIMIAITHYNALTMYCVTMSASKLCCCVVGSSCCACARSWLTINSFKRASSQLTHISCCAHVRNHTHPKPDNVQRDRQHMLQCLNARRVVRGRAFARSDSARLAQAALCHDKHVIMIEPRQHTCKTTTNRANASREITADARDRSTSTAAPLLVVDAVTVVDVDVLGEDSVIKLGASAATSLL
jgi:hypothetical protein